MTAGRKRTRDIVDKWSGRVLRRAYPDRTADKLAGYLDAQEAAFERNASAAPWDNGGARVTASYDHEGRAFSFFSED